MTQSNLAVVQTNQIPEGWVDSKNGKKRTMLCVGDVTVLLLKTFNTTWRFNRLTMLIELDGVPIPGKEIDLLWVTLSLRGWHVARNAAIDGALAAAYANAFDPVQEYLNRIEADESIEPADLSTIASTYLGTKDDLYDAMLRATLIGAVARTFNPGCMFKTALVLKGGQNIGKSSVVRNLASPDWVCDTSQDNDKDFLQAIHSGWIYELAELDSIVSKKEAGKLKNLISSPKDTFRPPYGRRMESHKRQSIFIGTSNRDDFLRDETGACRWWVVELPQVANKGSRIDHDRVRQDRDAIFKAAVTAFRAGELPLLTDEQQAESDRRNLGFEVDHPWEDFIVEWLEKPGTPAAFTTEQCLYLSGCLELGYSAPTTQTHLPPASQKDSVEAGKILRRLGYEKDKHQRRFNGKKQRRMWRLVDASSASTPEPLPEAGQTPTGGSEVSDPPHVSSPSIEKEQGQEEEQTTADALLGKTPEAPEAPLGSGFDVQDMDEWTMWDIPLNRSA